MKYLNKFQTQLEYDNAKLSYPNVSYIKETEKVILVKKLLPKNNQIFYTSTDGNIVTPYTYSKSKVISNVYEDGLGVMTFESDVITIDDLFYNRYSLESVIIPQKTKEIIGTSFWDCSALTSVSFVEDTKITKIGGDAFYGCSGLTSLDLTNSLVSIDNAFRNVPNFKLLNYYGSLEEYKNIVGLGNLPELFIVKTNDGEFDRFGEPLKIAYYTTSDNQLSPFNSVITNEYFDTYGLIKTTTSNFNGMVNSPKPTSISASTLFSSYTCSNNTSLINFEYLNDGEPSAIPNFYGCSKLTKFNSENEGEFIIPRSVTEIKNIDTSYTRGTKVKKIIIPSTVTYIGDNAFSNSSNITDVVFENVNTLKGIGKGVFDFVTWYKNYSADTNNQYENKVYIGNVAYGTVDKSIVNTKFKEGTVGISDLFYNNQELTEIVIPKSVEYIASNTFWKCSGLTNVTIEENSKLKYIGNSTFRETKITSLSLPSTITSIDAYAFGNCKNLTNVNYDGTSTQFKAITKGSLWKDGVPTSCIVHCTDGDYDLAIFP